MASQLLELLTQGRDALRRDPADRDGSGVDGVEGPPASAPSADTIAKLSQLTDDELLRFDDLLESDRDAARRFWRERFDEELVDEELLEDGRG